MHYVYEHYDPATEEIVYVGCGSGGRAWNFNKPFRTEDHWNWFQGQVVKGHHPGQLVRVISWDLSKSLAHALEQFRIYQVLPRFNRSIRSRHQVFGVADYDAARRLRDSGLSYAAIADALGFSAMTIHRNLNLKNITMEIALAERS